MGWQPPDGLDRMTLAAALEKLTGGYDEEAARQVIVGFYSLPAIKEGNYVADMVYREKCEVTDGNVAVDVSEDKYRSFGKATDDKTASIGRFIVYKSSDTFADCLGIVFSDSRSRTWEGLSEDPQPKWGMVFDAPSLEPLALIRIDFVPVEPGFWPKLIRLWLAFRTGSSADKCTYWEQSPTLLWIRKE